MLDTADEGRAKAPSGHRRAAFAARTSIHRREFGLTWNQASEASGVLVGGRIDMELEVQAVAQAVAPKVDASVAQAAG